MRARTWSTSGGSRPRPRRAVPYGFEIDMLPALPGTLDAAHEPTAQDEPAHEEAPAVPLGPEFARIEALAAARGVEITADQRAKRARLTEAQRELASKALQHGPMIKKLVIWIVVLVVAIQVLGMIISVVVAFAFNNWRHEPQEQGTQARQQAARGDRGPAVRDPLRGHGHGRGLDDLAGGGRQLPGARLGEGSRDRPRDVPG